MPGHRKHFRPAVVGLAEIGKALAALAQNVGNAGEGFGVVDGGRLAVEAETGRKRRLVARLPLFAFQRFQQRRFFAANIRAVAVVVKQVKRKAAVQNVVAQIARAARLLHLALHVLVDLPDFAVDVVVAAHRAHNVARENHPLNQLVGVAAHNVAVFKSAGLALVAVAHQIHIGRQAAGNERPFKSGGKTRAAASAQARFFHRRQQLFRRRFFRHHFFQGAIAARLAIGGEVGQIRLHPARKHHHAAVRRRLFRRLRRRGGGGGGGSHRQIVAVIVGGGGREKMGAGVAGIAVVKNSGESK